jgi:hypothetical protein
MSTPVKAPRSSPKIKDSMSVPGSAEPLTARKGACFFAERERGARLPLGLRFADDPETLFRELAREPAE